MSTDTTKQNEFDIKQVDDRLAEMYTSTGDKRAAYDEWARSYERDLVVDLDYVAHIDAAEIFNEVVRDRDARILDVACGSGLAGAELKRLGYTDIDGVDFSDRMLEVSRERGVYKSLFQHDFNHPLQIATRYDALLCVGMFAFNQPPITSLHNVVEAVTASGVCVVTVNGAAWKERDLEPVVEKEADEHGFLIERICTARYILKENIDARVLVIRRQ